MTHEVAWRLRIDSRENGRDGTLQLCIEPRHEEGGKSHTLITPQVSTVAASRHQESRA